MFKELEFSPRSSEIAPGWVVTVEPVKHFDMVEPGTTAIHEGIHVVATILTDNHVEEASIVPGPGYLGRTIAGFSPIAFMAPHAMGCDGTGHDISVVIWKGYDPNSLAEAARSTLAGHEDEIYAVSSLIEAQGTISGYEAKWIMDEITHPEAQVEITNPLGQKWEFVSKTRSTSNGYFIPTELPNPSESPKELDNGLPHPLVDKFYSWIQTFSFGSNKD